MKNIIILFIALTLAFDTKAQQKSISQLTDSLFRTDLNKNKPQIIQNIKLLNNFQIDQLVELLYKGTTGIVNESSATIGNKGKFNFKFNKVHNRKFRRRLENNGRENRKLVLIEGDSWFNFPIPGKSDLTKILVKDYSNSLLVTTSAYGGDWLAKMLDDKTIFSKIKRLNPDAVILSGGGNDIVGERLGSFIDNISAPQRAKIFYQKNGYNYFTDDTEITEGVKYLNSEFYKSVAQIEVIYRIIFRQIENDGWTNTDQKLLIQGYDYPIPNTRKPKFFCRPGTAVATLFSGKPGQHLSNPLKSKGINDAELQRKITKAMIYVYNEMLSELANEYKNVYHVDSRGLVGKLSGQSPRRYWFDELHPKKQAYDYISASINALINSPNKLKKIIKVAESVKLTPKQERKAKKKCDYCFRTSSN
jgi:lysophospholipase L1-like esterase